MRSIFPTPTMRYRIVVILMILTIPPSIQTGFGQNIDRRVAYVERFRAIAIREMQRTGIPASIKLAQGVLESGSGTSTLSTQGNNHFGIKCHSDWDGPTMYREDDDYDANGKLIKSCFRVYKNADESYIAHSEFLRNKQRYAFLFTQNTKDYEFWARGLQQAGYATAPTYGQSLINLIEDLQLNQYDNLAPNDPILAGNKPNSRRRPTGGNGVFYNNDTKAFFTSGNVSLEQIAGRFNVSVRNLKQYNECIGAQSEPIPDSTLVYLQSKAGYSHDRETKYHYVQPNETMCQISQRYGIKLSKLYKKNNMPEGTEPLAGERLILRRSNILGLWLESWETPKFRNAGSPDPNVPTNTNPNDKTPTPPVSNGNTKPDSKQPDELDIEITPGQAGKTGTNKPNPTTTTTTPDNSTPNPTTQPTTGTFHVVAKGETLWAISRKYSTTVPALQKLNGLSSTTIAAGQRLRVK